MVHRDVKPSNVLLGRDGSVKLGDFGIAFTPQGSQDITAQGTALGTPSFMSPEQLEDARAADSRADMWSLGVCFFELLTGRKFVTGPTPAAIREALPGVVRGMPGRLPSNIPFRYKRFLVRSLRMRPESRLRDGAAGLRLLGTAVGASGPPEDLRKRMNALFSASNPPDPTPEARKPSPVPQTREPESDSPEKKVKRTAIRLPRVGGSRVGHVPKRKTTASSAVSNLRISKRRPLSRRPWILALAVAAIAGFTVLLVLPGAWDILLRSNSYGMLKLELEYVQGTPDYWLSAVEARLYREEGESLKSVISPVFRRAPDNEQMLLSRRISLPAGAYRLRWNLGDKVSWHSFNLTSIRSQRASGISQKVLREELGPPPVFPLDFSWKVVDAVEGTDIGSAVLLTDRVDAPGKALESGGNYRFMINAPGYRSSTFSVPVSPWRRELHLSVSLWPQPARIVLENSSDRVFRPRLNGSAHYLDSSEEPSVRRISRLPAGESMVLTVLPGEYSLKAAFDRNESRVFRLRSGTEVRLTILRNQDNHFEFVVSDQ